MPAVQPNSLVFRKVGGQIRLDRRRPCNRDKVQSTQPLALQGLVADV